MPLSTRKSDHYILVGQTPVPVECDLYTAEGIAGLLNWARWFEHADRKIARTRLLFGLVRVSTVFLGLDHRVLGDGLPILFESMAFWRGEHGYEQERCSTWLEAEAMHREMCRQVMRPRSVAAYVVRLLRKYWRQAIATSANS